MVNTFMKLAITSIVVMVATVAASMYYLGSWQTVSIFWPITVIAAFVWGERIGRGGIREGVSLALASQESDDKRDMQSSKLLGTMLAMFSGKIPFPQAQTNPAPQFDSPFASNGQAMMLTEDDFTIEGLPAPQGENNDELPPN